jgi:hypothetical protein
MRRNAAFRPRNDVAQALDQRRAGARLLRLAQFERLWRIGRVMIRKRH